MVLVFCVTNEKIKAQRVKVTWLTSQSCRGQSWDLNPGHVAPQLTPLPTQCHGVLSPGSFTWFSQARSLWASSGGLGGGGAGLKDMGLTSGNCPTFTSRTVDHG